MGHYISNIIAIRTGGVFSDDIDIEKVKERINKIINNMRKIDEYEDFPDSITKFSMSNELSATKGSYVVMAGVFNYLTFEVMEFFSKELSKEFGVEVILTSWDEESDDFYSNMYLDGKNYFNVKEHPISRVIRRVD